MDMVTQKLAAFSEWLWDWPLVLLIMASGIFLTFFYKGKYITEIKLHFNNTYKKMFQKTEDTGKGTVSGFAAACTAMANTIGVGNIGGVASAIVSGGPGAVFWIWIADLFGISLKASEIILGQRYREKFDESMDEYVCDRSFVMKNSMGWKVGGIILAFFVVVFGPWTNVVQSEAVTSSVAEAFHINSYITLAVLGITVFVTIFGGLKRISGAMERVVPVMAIVYFGAVLILLLMNIVNVPQAFLGIIKSAFSPTAAVGGFAGASVRQAIRYGIARGVYSSDAGTGYGMVAHAPAITDHPIRQSSWGWGEVVVDLVVCTMTALAIIITKSYIVYPDITSAHLTTVAFGHVFGNIGTLFMGVAITVFAWTTIIGLYYSCEKSINYIFGDSKFNKIAVRLYMLYFLVPIIFFSNLEADLLWAITDLISGMYVIVTLILIFANLKEIKRLFNDFWYRFLPEKEKGENPPVVSYGEVKNK